MWESLVKDISLLAVSIYVTLAVFEVALDLRHKTGHYKLKDSLCSLTMGGFYLGTKFLMVYVIVDLCSSRKTKRLMKVHDRPNTSVLMHH